MQYKHFKIYGSNDYDFCFTYFDDILVASQNETQHKTHLKVLFDKLQHYGTVINPNKYTFGQC